MFLRLISLRIRSGVNVVRYNWSVKPSSVLGYSLSGLSVFCLISYSFLRLFMLLRSSTDTLNESIYQVFYFLMVLLFASAVPFVGGTLLQAGDYNLLCATPIRPMNVVAAKLLDATVTNSLQFSLIGVPAVAAAGLALHLPILGWPVLLLLTILLALLPALITALLLLIALSIVGMNRVRAAMTAINLIMASVVCITFVIQAGNLPFHLGPAGQIVIQGTSKSVMAHASPSALFADTLISFASGDISYSLASLGWILLVNFILFGLCTLMGSRLLSAAAVADEIGERISVRSGDHRGLVASTLEFLFHLPIVGFVTKDFKFICRDSILLSQMIMPLILFFVPFAIVIQPDMRRMVNNNELYMISLGMLGMIIFMQTSVLSLTCIGLEGRGFVLPMASPNSIRSIVLAKFYTVTGFTGAVALSLIAVDAVIFHATLFSLILQALAAVLCCVALCGLGVGISAALPRFVYENPAHRVSVWALVIGFLTSTGYVVVAGVTGGLTAYLASEAPEFQSWIILGGVTIFALVSVIPAVVSLVIGSKMLSRMQWEY